MEDGSRTPEDVAAKQGQGAGGRDERDERIRMMLPKGPEDPRAMNALVEDAFQELNAAVGETSTGDPPVIKLKVTPKVIKRVVEDQERAAKLTREGRGPVVTPPLRERLAGSPRTPSKSAVPPPTRSGPPSK